jgi:hypothetical protein
MNVTPNSDTLAAWCQRYLGSVPEETLFTTGNLAKVFGLRLADGRRVVVKIRPSEARQVGCAVVQRHLWQAGFPCPEPLAGPVPWDGGSLAANAETLIPGGTPYPPDDGPDRAFAGLLARFIALAPGPDRVPDLAPPPAWIHWDHRFPGLWPPPDDRAADLNTLPETAWLDRFGRSARERLAATRPCARVTRHCDWESGVGLHGDLLRGGGDGGGQTEAVVHRKRDEIGAAGGVLVEFGGRITSVVVVRVAVPTAGYISTLFTACAKA